MIVNILKGIFSFMVATKPIDFKSTRRLARRAMAGGRPRTAVDLRLQAEEALRAEEGMDFGPLSHAERNKIIFGI